MGIFNASGASTVIKNTVDFLMPDSTEKLIFRRYPGFAIREAINSGTEIDNKKIDMCILRINPNQINFQKRKIIQKVQTSAPGRFITFDWGTDLTVLTIDGNTGNLLPDEIITNPVGDVLQSISDQGIGINGNVTTTVANVQAQISHALMHSTSYFEKLKMSPKFLAFKRLEKMYELSNADSDVITLELGEDNLYRGFFEDFTFAIVAESPWNWKYTINFVILSDLNALSTRWDNQFDYNNQNIITASNEGSL